MKKNRKRVMDASGSFRCFDFEVATAFHCLVLKHW